MLLGLPEVAKCPAETGNMVRALDLIRNRTNDRPRRCLRTDIEAGWRQALRSRPGRFVAVITVFCGLSTVSGLAPDAPSSRAFDVETELRSAMTVAGFEFLGPWRGSV